ncbi:short-chain dehydrogenase/reductase [Streptomyces omiyaensis]|uniref:oxidoreductase n=1 Tax=Streptomyces omiyaensis TaxID=68247 RepID=UPI0016781614|nr:oxidoreductase [Streptomyces omiyaensis]GGY85233.1 short-chain dehydrogenase/reductase [Streptomyces omiyaensis]
MSKVWLITGANSGFGRAFTEAAVAAGDVVVAGARRAGALDGLVAAHPDQVDAVTLDVTDHAAVDRVVGEVAERHGRIDVLVDNAGRTHVGSVEETDDVELRSLFDVHVFGPAALTRAVLPYMRARRSGAIVQVSSVGGQMSTAGFGAYSATKFALEGMSEALAAEVGPLGIHVLIVEPGAFRTSLFGNGGLGPDTIADYADTVGATRAYVQGGDGGQAGDPAKAAAAVLAALNADEKPLRLALGSDSIDTIHAHLEQVRGDLTAWEEVGRDTRLEH